MGSQRRESINQRGHIRGGLVYFKYMYLKMSVIRYSIYSSNCSLKKPWKGSHLYIFLSFCHWYCNQTHKESGRYLHLQLKSWDNIAYQPFFLTSCSLTCQLLNVYNHMYVHACVCKLVQTYTCWRVVPNVSGQNLTEQFTLETCRSTYSWKYQYSTVLKAKYFTPLYKKEMCYKTCLQPFLPLTRSIFFLISTNHYFWSRNNYALLK